LSLMCWWLPAIGEVMGTEKIEPKVFANKVIQQLVQHLLAEDMTIEPKSYALIRSVFRKCHGSWEQLGAGDVWHIELLKKVVTAWGKTPGRVKESERLV